MARGLHRLPLEKPIYELEDKIADLETAPLGQQSQEEVQQLRRECADLQNQIFSNLDPWQSVEVARHPNRPKTSDYLGLVFDEFVAFFHVHLKEESASHPPPSTRGSAPSGQNQGCNKRVVFGTLSWILMGI